MAASIIPSASLLERLQTVHYIWCFCREGSVTYSPIHQQITQGNTTFDVFVGKGLW